MSRLTTYFKETRAELKHVTWPTRKQATLYTILVITISVATALYLGAFDFIFTTLLKLVV
ncbi:MAG: preprotein translocase subunit SecE [Candidatus Taylorbacteria bacterium CG11_big_fil_rev_8_21_14_0_20_46_11]|uniref:Protein translocase subunit SecE n=1 Tax=Candidatus Taylorbacteria bacterium CG11_big_fil_rev_8_21_14_0_20_46_11 TaxID=1975025 RepID=A0A2H0KA37_9BACT|nr:MAG: preprotein translocase subunit SecE [Candidatus Taylorbacteria bacterium CG11_big_fil_rev_8_21_14_0_20_46_11]